jgi:hypothetical protein
MMKFVETGLLRDVVEHDRSIVHEAASRDRTSVGIFDGGMRGPSGDSSACRRRFLLVGFLAGAGNRGKQNRE